MQLNKHDLEKFKKIWIAEFGEEIDDARALKEAERLLLLISFAMQRRKVDPPDGKNKTEQH